MNTLKLKAYFVHRHVVGVFVFSTNKELIENSRAVFKKRLFLYTVCLGSALSFKKSSI